MKAIAVHTYFGGMTLGVEQADVDVLASVETWGQSFKTGTVAGCKQCSASDAPREAVDLVFANPPCSRYSNTAAHKFTSAERNDPAHFDEMREILGIAEQAQAVWWETGPQYWKAGRGMARGIHEHCVKMWGAATTVVLRIDPRWCGNPQRRPRTHHITFKGDVNVSDEDSWPRSLWPVRVTMNLRLGDYLDHVKEETEFDGVHTPCKPNGFFTDTPNEEDVKWMRLAASFTQGRPQAYHDTDWYSLTVLSGRMAAWVEERRWVSIEEWAQIMTVPWQHARRVALTSSGGTGEALMMLSKGVAPVVSRYVMNHVVRPGLEQGAIPSHGMWGDGLHEIDWNVPDRPKRTAK